MIALDTSVVVPALASWHEAHQITRRAARGGVVPAHVNLEAYAVLTRLPPPYRLDPTVARELLAAWFPSKQILVPSARLHRSMVNQISEAGIVGGACYDAVIGLTAQSHGAELLTRDARARRTYDILGIRYRVVSE